MIENNLKVIKFDPAEWKERAACKGMDVTIFFPRQGEPNHTALKVCESCEVRKECLKFAMDNFERYGVWGGYSERRRRTIRRMD